MKENNQMKKTVFIGLGTNIENREENLKTALKNIEKIGKIKKKSSIYEAEPIGYKKQKDFLNMVIEIETDFSPKNLLKELQKIEDKMGRTREIKNGPRTIDLDILFYEEEIIDEKDLKIPHPKLHKRNFVLKPLKEIAPEKIYPKLKNPKKAELWTQKKLKN